VNTSNQHIRDFITGKSRRQCPSTGSQFWVDVRDAALAHAVAAEREDAAGKRLFLTAGNFCNKKIVEIIGEAYPQLRDELPQGEEALKAGAYPPGGPKYGFDNARSINELGIEYTTLEDTVKDTVGELTGDSTAELNVPWLITRNGRRWISWCPCFQILQLTGSNIKSALNHIKEYQARNSGKFV
jgi:nucleoside-diphosphate-sugar epimerase